MLFKGQKGIIQLGVLGILVLAAGLLVASKLASNPDLTFFNIAERAKEIQKDICDTKRGKYLVRCKEKSKKGNNSSDCKGWTSCKRTPLEGAKVCASGGITYYCCFDGKRDWGNGKCEKEGDCSKFVCSEKKVEGSSTCYDAKHKNGWNCCSEGGHLDTSTNPFRCIETKVSD